MRTFHISGGHRKYGRHFVARTEPEKRNRGRSRRDKQYLPECYSRHRQIAKLATRGLFVLDGNVEDCYAYLPGRFDTESLQQAPCQERDCFVRPDSTGTLQTLLAAKGSQLPRTVRNRLQQNTLRSADTDFKERKMFAL